MLLLEGLSVGDALREVGRSARAYEEWRRDAAFRAQVNGIRERRGFSVPDRRGAARREAEGGGAAADVRDPRSLSFAEFSERYLHQRVFPHSQNIVDLIEGREPSWLHPSMELDLGGGDVDLGWADRVMVNCPPEHAKTTMVTINYSVYRICMDPSVKIILLSKTLKMAKKMLMAVKKRLTDPQYIDLIRDFAPPGGFDADSDSWSAEMIYVAGRDVESGHPTVEAKGIHGHIYGSRADLIICDDLVDRANAHDWESQLDWIESEVHSRLSDDGMLLMVGTRLAAEDFYLKARDAERYTDGDCPWVYLAMPAVLEYADDPKDWVTLWPATNAEPRQSARRPRAQRPDGLWPMWDGPALARKRRGMTPELWGRLYQQKQIASDMTFKPAAVAGCTNAGRNVGRIPRGHPRCRPQGMDGLHVVAGLDPATSGFTAATVVALDPVSGRRFVLDVRNKRGLGVEPDRIRQLIYELTDRYGISEWVIETNGFQGFLANDTAVRQFLALRGVTIRPHHTGVNKRDPDFGVAAMSLLFQGWEDGHNLIELPSPHMSEGVKALVDQLVAWVPSLGRKLQQDAVMSLWMAELACQRRMEQAHSGFRGGRRNRWVTPAGRRRQRTVSAMDAAELVAGSREH